jgi:hypothetical protein
MHKTIFKGLTGLLLPFAAYAAPVGYGAYQRRQPVSAVSHQTLFDVVRPYAAPATHMAAVVDESELAIAAGSAVKELVIIDSNVPDQAVLLSAARPGVETVVLQNGADALEQTVALLKNYRNLDAVHLVSHGEAGAILLGDRRIDKEALEARPEFMAALGAATRAGADLLLYGCNLASENTELLEVMQRDSGLDIAASNNLTGAAALGGDWALEIQAGNIEAAQVFSEKALKDFSAVLKPFGTKTFEGFNSESYQVNPSVNFGDFTTFIQSTDLELLSGTITSCTNDLYVSMYGYYDDSSRFYIRSEPSGDSFGVTQLILRRPASQPATQVNIQGLATLGSTTANASKKRVRIAAAGTKTGYQTPGKKGSCADIAKLRNTPTDNSKFCVN